MSDFDRPKREADVLLRSASIGVASPANRGISLRGVFVIVTVAAILLGAIGYARLRAARWQVELARLAKLDQTTKKEIVAEVEAVRAKLGRAPADEAELESLLGKPLPVVHDNGYPTPINYYRTSENSFMLQYELWATDDWIYSSDAPTAGWVQHWY
ncbi:MAG: hypothetical protein WD971_03895 [Pirellulales bacterium]